MSALRAMLFLLLCGIAPNASAAKLHHLNIGFNLGYPDRVHFLSRRLRRFNAWMMCDYLAGFWPVMTTLVLNSIGE